jgi:pimeloyl-ACP methyl ester carboxylesterase
MSDFNKTHSMNIILIHGSWHSAWCWHKVIPCLQAMGHAVHAPDLPGHGRNGIETSTAAQMRPDKLSEVVYLAACMLKHGQRAASFPVPIHSHR